MVKGSLSPNNSKLCSCATTPVAPTCTAHTACRHGGGAAQQLVDTGAVHAVLHALLVALRRAQHLPAFIEPAFTSLRTACFTALAAMASQVGIGSVEAGMEGWDACAV